VPRYEEVNPGLFTIATFPFLFGIMYGDIGHGTILTIACLLMLVFEKQLDEMEQRGEMPEVLRMAFGGRYLLVMMSICAIYVGTIYNDCMSIPTNVWGSQWNFSWNADGTEFGAARISNNVYPYGVDPAWYHTSNQLVFFNSVKMKLAVILGVTQMTFGISLGLFNHMQFKTTSSICLEWIPQMLFMLCTFGYMITLIIIKWVIPWSSDTATDIQIRPNLIQTMINMFLNFNGLPDDQYMYPNQNLVQDLLVVTAVLSVPVMLFGKPCYLSRKHKPHAPPAVNYDQMVEDHDREAEHKAELGGHGADGGAAAHAVAAAGGKDAKAAAGGHEEEGHTFGDLMIHQGIHTIEFVLGAISNTASYLRLWALSLAHSELAEVFWGKLLGNYGIEQKSALFIVIGFAVWATTTVGVLLMMDVLECFLHALRLHWVEFQNKFYLADGYAFVPFSFVKSLDD